MTEAGYEIGVLADDLTGSLVSAARLRTGGLRPLVLWHRHRPPVVYDALVADMRTRDWSYPAAETAAAWAAWLRSVGCRRLELRVDSTLRGEPAAELRGLLAGAGLTEACVLAAPAFPEAGRFTLAGRQRMGPGKGPADVDIDVATRLFPDEPVRHIELGDLEDGPTRVAALVSEASEKGVRRFVGDVAEARHLEVLARAVAELEDGGVRVVTVSSGSWLSTHPIRRGEPRGLVVLVVASPTRQNQEQLEQVLRCQPGACILHAQSFLRRSPVDWERLRESGLLVVETIRSESCQERGGEQAPLAATVASMVLGEARDHGLRCKSVVVSGGHTASCLVDALGAGAIQAKGEVWPLCPRGVIAGGEWDALEIATKGGLVGDQTTLNRILDAVMEYRT